MRITIITGEASGDLYGSLLAHEILSLAPQTRLTGIGGAEMAKSGVDLFLSIDDLSIVGFWEALTQLPKLRKAFLTTKRMIENNPPDLLILIDYPGFNLRIASFARSKGIKVLYYIPPQIWAWGAGRIKSIKRNVTKTAVILPFESEIYTRNRVDAVYVGHPLLDVVRVDMERDEFLGKLGLSRDRSLVTLLPGSRMKEVERHIDPLLETAHLLTTLKPDIQFVIPTFPNFYRLIQDRATNWNLPLKVIDHGRYEAMKYSDLAILCSGTATLEAAILGTPAIVIYKLALFSWIIGKLVVKVPFVSLTNLVAGKEVFPEYLQGAVKPSKLADEALEILNDRKRRSEMLQELSIVKERLGPPGASKRVAQLALSLIGNQAGERAL